MKLKDRYRSGLEERVAKQLREEGVKVAFEGRRIPYLVPQREAKYLPDFEHVPSGIILETKGWFQTASERQKYILVRASNPGLDIRFVFSSASKKIYKGSKTTYAKWADDHDFKWADKGLVPAGWINEMREAAKGK